jgi:L-2-hydroxyglutarate oxidase
MKRSYDVLCIGAGIVGLATSIAIAERFRCRVGVLEAEQRVADHQTGRNSGVLHSGLYYPPGSSKARNCVAGRRRLVEFCRERSIRHQVCGKLVVATEEEELPRLEELERRGRANGLEGLKRLEADEIRQHEPHAVGLAALWVPQTGIVDYREVANAFAEVLEELGGEIHLGSGVRRIDSDDRRVRVETAGETFESGYLVNCAGLQSDRVARLAGRDPETRIVPFRGDYFDLAEDRRHLLRNLIYPVPDPRFPFLGVHLTRRVDESVEAGPNAVLAFHRHGYGPPSFSLRDSLDTLTFPGFWRLAARFWRIGAREYLRAGSRENFARALRRFVPEIRARDLTRGGCGIRAQALDRQGRLVDDFAIDAHGRALHVLNAPSPAATACLAIGDDLAELAGRHFHLSERRSA